MKRGWKFDIEDVDQLTSLASSVFTGNAVIPCLMDVVSINWPTTKGLIPMHQTHRQPPSLSLPSLPTAKKCHQTPSCTRVPGYSTIACGCCFRGTNLWSSPEQEHWQDGQGNWRESKGTGPRYSYIRMKTCHRILIYSSAPYIALLVQLSSSVHLVSQLKR